MTRESVLNRITKCPICKTVYLPENGEICKCDRPTEEDFKGAVTEALKHVPDQRTDNR